MNLTGKTLLLLSALGLSFNAQAITPDRYETIIDRNVFRLTSPPPPPAPATNTDALDKIIELTGISNFGGQKKAWFTVKSKTAKEPLYLNIAENVRQDFLEVIKISEEEGKVEVINAGSPMTLSFTNNAPKALPVSAVPAVARAVTSVAPPQPVSYANATPSYGGNSVTVTGGNSATPSAQPLQGNDASSGLRTIPTRQLRLTPAAQPQAETPVDPQKQRELMEIQEAVYNAAGVPLPPLPPAPGIRGGTPAPPPPLP